MLGASSWGLTVVLLDALYTLVFSVLEYLTVIYLSHLTTYFLFTKEHSFLAFKTLMLDRAKLGYIVLNAICNCGKTGFKVGGDLHAILAFFTKILKLISDLTFCKF
jgi:hypothetical protein